MKTFKPCIGRDYCAEEGEFCKACGRTVCEIKETRILIDDMAVIAMQLNFENTADFLHYAASKAAKKVVYWRKQAEEELAHEPA